MENPLLLIAGARRTGTTLLTRLLENTSSVLQFPFETNVLKSYYSSRYKLFQNYYQNEFLFNPEEGRQGVASSEKRFNSFLWEVKKNYNIDAFDLDIIPDKFHDGYQEFLEKNPLNAKNIYCALFSGLINGNPYTKEHYDQTKYLLSKTPESVELYARNLFKDHPETKFIHIIRHPYEFYTSIKSRRTTRNKGGKRILRHRVNRQDFLTGTLPLSLKSLEKGLENQLTLGKDNYKIIYYEDLVTNPKETLMDICFFLNIRFNNDLLIPTVFGKRRQTSSVLNKNTDYLIPINTSLHKDFKQYTTVSERKLLQFYLSESRYPEIYRDIPLRRIFPIKSWLKPFKYEVIKIYLWRILTLKGLPFPGKKQKWLNKLSKESPVINSLHP